MLPQAGCNLAERARETGLHVLEIVSYIHERTPESHILVNAVMPRAGFYAQKGQALEDSFYLQPSVYDQQPPFACIAPDLGSQLDSPETVMHLVMVRVACLAMSHYSTACHPLCAGSRTPFSP